MRDVLEFWIQLHSHPEIEISFKFIPKLLMSKDCIHFIGPLYIRRLQLLEYNTLQTSTQTPNVYGDTCHHIGSPFTEYLPSLGVVRTQVVPRMTFRSIETVSSSLYLMPEAQTVLRYTHSLHRYVTPVLPGGTACHSVCQHHSFTNPGFRLLHLPSQSTSAATRSRRGKQFGVNAEKNSFRGGIPRNTLRYKADPKQLSIPCTATTTTDGT